ncbi:MAG: hypothetical protein Ct9H90mP27_1890 [Gammaproteobacteria bacterium]|nr:MAG: hypothetical protein Ct9H90mP27_1890 [Gammaproteobacteria bacterium]
MPIGMAALSNSPANLRCSLSNLNNQNHSGAKLSWYYSVLAYKNAKVSSKTGEELQLKLIDL